jgi:hypothetical protein
MNKSYRIILLSLLISVFTAKPMLSRFKFVASTTAAIGIISIGYHIWKNYSLGRNIGRIQSTLEHRFDEQDQRMERIEQGVAEIRESGIPQLMDSLQRVENATGTNRIMLTITIKMHFAQLTVAQRETFLESIEDMELPPEISGLFRVAAPN